MVRAGVEWNDDNVEYLTARHNIYPEAVEQVFANDPHIRAGRGVACAYG